MTGPRLNVHQSHGVSFSRTPVVQCGRQEVPILFSLQRWIRTKTNLAFAPSFFAVFFRFPKKTLYIVFATTSHVSFKCALMSDLKKSIKSEAIQQPSFCKYAFVLLELFRVCRFNSLILISSRRTDGGFPLAMNNIVSVGSWCLWGTVNIL